MSNKAIEIKKEEKPEKYHYLVGIGFTPSTASKDAGQPYLDYFFDYTDSDLNQLMAEKIIDNCLDKDETRETAQKDQAKSGERCEAKFQQALVIAKFRSNIHGLNACLFHSTFKLNQEELESYIRTKIKELGVDKFMELAKVKI
jgi:hypothetical protein